MQTRTTNRQNSDIVVNCRVPIRRAQAILCDISQTGCRIEMFDGFVQRGCTIFFELDETTEVAGQAMWVEGNEAGVRFLHRLSPAAMRVLEI